MPGGGLLTHCSFNDASEFTCKLVLFDCKVQDQVMGHTSNEGKIRGWWRERKHVEVSVAYVKVRSSLMKTHKSHYCGVDNATFSLVCTSFGWENVLIEDSSFLSYYQCYLYSIIGSLQVEGNWINEELIVGKSNLRACWKTVFEFKSFVVDLFFKWN